MPSVSQVLKDYGNAYIAQFGQRMTSQQKKVLRAVIACREDRLGTIRYRCACCGNQQTVPRSCCNRHCSACQWQKQRDWVARQQRLLLPCHYFMITFTLPAALRAVAMLHPDVVYPALMKAAAESLKTGATNERFVGAKETGFFGVLHTWGRELSYHPHVHFLVPGGGISAGGHWKNSRVSVFVPEQVLETLFRKKLKPLLDAVGLLDQVPREVWTGRFVVNSKAIGTGEHALKYLAPYVSRGCVANWRVSRCDAPAARSLAESQLVLQVKRSGTKRYRGQPMSVVEFIRRWLLHVCPNGLHRVRHYGFLNAHSRRSVEELRLLIAVSLNEVHYLACSQIIVAPARLPMQCSLCGGPMLSVGYLPPGDRTAVRSRAPP